MSLSGLGFAKISGRWLKLDASELKLAGRTGSLPVFSIRAAAVAAGERGDEIRPGPSGAKWLRKADERRGVRSLVLSPPSRSNMKAEVVRCTPWLILKGISTLGWGTGEETRRRR